MRGGRAADRARIAHQDGQHASSRGGQAASDDEAVAAVVARAAEDHGQRRLVGRRGEPGQLDLCDLGNRGPGALHERVCGDPQPLRRLIDLGHLGRANEDRPGPCRPVGRIGQSVFRYSAIVLISAGLS